MARGNGWGLLVMLIVNPLVIILYQNASVLSPKSLTSEASQNSDEPNQNLQAKARSTPDQSTRDTVSVASEIRAEPLTLKNTNLRAPASLGFGTALPLDREAIESQNQENKCRFIRPVCQE